MLMTHHFEKLTEEETEFLFKAPALVSVLAANWDHQVSRNAKDEAIKLAHLKTFTAVPLLQPYYKEVEKGFKDNFETIVEEYAPFDEEKMDALRRELVKLNVVISKLDKEYAQTLLWSLSKFAAQVKKSDRELLENFIFPFKLPGLTD